jgi:hypothetical protein
LKQTVPGLNGLKDDHDQNSLPEIHLSDAIGSMLPRLPNLISRENIIHFQGARDSLAPNNPAASQLWTREFRYLLSSQIDVAGNTTIREVRTDSKGRVANSMGALSGLRGYGFANQWLFFSSANQSQFRFRYLGRQKKTGYMTYVVAFAQEPKKVDDPAYFMADGKSAAFYYQGIPWIDESSFSIVALRSDLLAPLPALHLLQFSTDITFSLVKIPGLSFTTWLPHTVEIATDEGAGISKETHSYTDYHLYRSEATILP